MSKRSHHTPLLDVAIAAGLAYQDKIRSYWWGKPRTDGIRLGKSANAAEKYLQTTTSNDSRKLFKELRSFWALPGDGGKRALPGDGGKRTKGQSPQRAKRTA